MSKPACLIVNRGFPYDEGATLPLGRGTVVLGRRDAVWEPDIAFDNVFVSRKQAAISYERGVYVITDLDSKHGTSVNDKRLAPHEPTLLGDADRITFAKGLITLSFSTHLWEETMDFSPLAVQAAIQAAPTGHSAAAAPAAVLDFAAADGRLDPVRQTLTIEDESVHLSDKEYRCLELLARMEGQFVSKEDVVRYVWPERATDESLLAVGAEEINSLLYRLRKKTERALAIESIRGKGYVLTFAASSGKSV